MSRFSVESVFKAVDKVTAPVTRMQNRVGRFTRSLQRGLRGVNRMTSKVARGIKSMAKAGVVGFGILAGSMSVLAQSGLDFEQAIVDVGAVSLQTREQIKPLEDMAKRLGATTKFTATEAAQAMEVLARAGFSTQQILEATPAVLSAAAASGLEIAEVADHVSNVLKGMGLSMDQTVRVADVLTLASARTNSSIGSLGESMRNVASTARQLGVPLEDAVASVALLQDVGLDASVAGSALNTMLTQMAAPSTSLQRKMRRMGVSFKDAKGDMLPLTDVLQQLSKASQKAGGNFDKVAFLAELVGLRGQKAAANLADLFDEGRVQELSKELSKAAGAADKMANIRMDTTRGSLTLLSSAIDAVKVGLFDMNSGPLRETVDRMTTWVNANQELITSKFSEYLSRFIEALPEIWGWMKKIGTALAVFYAFHAILSTLVGVLTLVNLVMAANPIGLIVLGVAAAVLAFAALVTWVDDVAAAFDNMNPFVRTLLAPLELVVRTVKFIKDALKGGFGNAVKKLALSFGFGEEEAEAKATQAQRAQVVSPQDRTAKMIEERRTTSTAEVTIRDETKRAEVTKGTLGAGLFLQPSGGF